MIQEIENKASEIQTVTNQKPQKLKTMSFLFCVYVTVSTTEC